jgi:3',5'-cyclic AMP phosphodiesterase CpdA
MQSIKFITFTDIHISDINPQSRTGSYKEDILDKLGQIKLAGAKLGVDFFMCPGDIFNLKAPLRNSHALNTTLIDLFNSFPAPIFITEGNHDLRNDSYESFDEQPLRVLYSSGALKQLRSHVFSKGDFNITLRAFPFEEDPNLLRYPKAEGTFSVCLLHLYASPEGGSLFRHKIFSYKDISVLGDDIFVLGHYHIDQGVKALDSNNKKQYFINVGALSRGALDEDNLERSPKISYVALVKESTGKINVNIQAIKLKVKTAQEVFKIEEKRIAKERMELADSFVESLKNATAGEEDPKVIEDRLLSQDNVAEASKEFNVSIDKQVIDKARYFMQEADLLIKGNLK